jgi:membrane-bound lytic murein transglycosylase A
VTANPPSATLVPVGFDQLAGWREDDHRAAFQAFHRSAAVLASHPPRPRSLGIDAVALAQCLARASTIPDDISADAARAFFEAELEPVNVAGGSGFFTGYYEPIVAGSLTKDGRFCVPLYAPPDDLVEIDPERPPPGIEAGFRFARRTAAGFTPYADRAEIEGGALSGKGLELVYLADPVDAFFIHIQGAARIALPDGRTMRVTYAAKTGHPYTPIGRVLIEKGALTKGGATMRTIRAWLAAHPFEAPAVMAANRSFIFFREEVVEDPQLGPVAAAKVPLTPGRSLAVDRLLHSFHMPVWVEATLPDGSRLQRLMVAQDTGSAIVGPARGDIFFGSGDEAGAIAGEMRSTGRFVILGPRGSALSRP